MRIIMTNRWWNIFLMMILPMSACGYHPSEQEKETVSTMTSEMRTWAIGRHLVELPSTWRYGIGSNVTLYYGLGSDFETVDARVVAEDVSLEDFNTALRLRADRIGAVTNNRTNGPMLLLSRNLSDGLVMLRYFDTKSSSDHHRHELHILKGGVYVLLSADSFDGVIGPVETRLQELAKQIDKVVVPERVGAGFVLGPIIIRSRHDHERGTIYFNDPERRDVTLEVDISAVTPDEDVRLSQRARRDEAGFGLPASSTLRDGAIQLAGMNGEEVLWSYDSRSSREEESHRELIFSAESYRPDPGFMRPMLSFRLTAGGQQMRPSMPVRPESLATRAIPSFARPSSTSTQVDSEKEIDASLTDHEAMAVWDAILKSVSPRPGAVAAPPERVSSAYNDPIEIAEQMRKMNAWLAELPPSGSPKRPGQS